MPAGRGTCLPTASNSCEHKAGRQICGQTGEIHSLKMNQTSASITPDVAGIASVSLSSQFHKVHPQIPGMHWKHAGDVLPHRNDSRAGWGHCGAVRECTMPSDCGTSHLPPYQSAARSPGEEHKSKTVKM